jgi:hypothetical protein
MILAFTKQRRAFKSEINVAFLENAEVLLENRSSKRVHMSDILGKDAYFEAVLPGFLHGVQQYVR